MRRNLTTPFPICLAPDTTAIQWQTFYAAKQSLPGLDSIGISVNICLLREIPGRAEIVEMGRTAVVGADFWWRYVGSF